MTNNTSPNRILIVDDEDALRQMLADMLTRAGYECLHAKDLEAGVRLLETEPVDVVVTDLRMPGSDAEQVVPTLEQASGGTVPFIVLTGHPTVETAVESVSRNVCAYLVKPVPRDVLLEAVGRCLRGKAVRASMTRSFDRVGSWHAELETLLARPQPMRAPSSLDPQAFTAMTLRNIIASLEDLSRVTSMASTQEANACHLFNCPRLEELTRAVEDAVEVLERTKHAFKSKELGALRGRLETVLTRSRP